MPAYPAGQRDGQGEIFVLDMGESVKIAFLAEQMIHLSGKVPDVDIDIVYTGLRPGEKLYEELFHEKEALQSTPHDKILLARHRELDWRYLTEILDEMAVVCSTYDEDSLRGLLSELVPEWSGYNAEIPQAVTRDATDKISTVAPEPPVLH